MMAITLVAKKPTCAVEREIRHGNDLHKGYRSYDRTTY